MPDLLAQDTTTYPSYLSFIPEIIASERAQEKRNLDSYLKMLNKVFSLELSMHTIYVLGKYFLYWRVLKSFNKIEKYAWSRIAKLFFHTDVLIKLIKDFKVDYASFHIHLIDSFSHQFWKYYEPEKFPDGFVSKKDIRKYHNLIPYAYKCVDKAIGRILKKVDVDILVIASDHGSKATLSDKKHPFVIKAENFLDILGIKEKESATYFVQSTGITVRLRDNEIRGNFIPLVHSLRCISDGTSIFLARKN